MDEEQPLARPSLPDGWEKREVANSQEVFYYNSLLKVSQWDNPATLPGRLYYRYDGTNGINPAQFEVRDVATKILEHLPRTLKGAPTSNIELNVLLHGPPASGKSSIMGHLYVALKKRAPVYYVQAGAFMTDKSKDDIYNAIITASSIEKCFVLLDDAQAWYSYQEFFGLFKGTGNVVVAAATFSAQQINAGTPVTFHRVESKLTETEIQALIQRLGVGEVCQELGATDQLGEITSQLVAWFGDHYGRYHFLVPPLLDRWRILRSQDASMTLADTFYRAATMEDRRSTRFLPELDEKFKPLLLKIWKGTATAGDKATLVPYGILREDKEWSCEYVRRKYFYDLFQDSNPVSHLFESGVPSELELAKAGLKDINWNRLRMCKGSSTSSFPVENIWQAEFYSSIGHHVPTQYTFCKEEITTAGIKTGNVDFVLRNGGTRAIEFLVKSDRVGAHHERFERGAYRPLKLSGSYLVVDIKPWGPHPLGHDLHDVSEEEKIDFANECFHDSELNPENRRLHHAVFVVNNDLTGGLLFAYDATSHSAVAHF